jgi:signal transduction histidine kinase
MFRAVCSEALGALDAHGTRLLRYEGDTTTCVIVAECGEFGDGRPRSSAITLDVPVLVEGRRWGTMSAAFGSVHDSAADAEQRLAQFVDLLSIGLANVHARAELAASRARIVVAADDARRRIERDLHDGVQQRLISLSLEARHAEEMAEHDGSAELREVLARVSQHLGDAFDELREIALGIHPAILAHGGLGPAVRALARRSPVPVTTDLEPGLRLPERTEVAAYYVVSEALTNTAKHAHASGAEVSAVLAAGQLELTIRDDGIGGATPERGSGLIGLADRVAALNGTIEVTSPPGEGTTVFVTFPIDGVT